jgi:hypothetical protein
MQRTLKEATAARPQEKVTESHRSNPLVDNKSDLSKIALVKGEGAKSWAPLLGIPTSRFLNLEAKVMSTRDRVIRFLFVTL